MYYTNVSAVPFHGAIIAQLTKGPWYFVFVAYSYLSFVFGFVVFYRSWKISKYSLQMEMKEIIRSIVFSEISEGIVVTDDRQRIIDFNNSAQKTFAWLSPVNIGKKITCFEEGRKIIENESASSEIKIIKEGHKQYYKFHVSEIKVNKNYVGRVYIFEDITTKNEMLARLNDLAYKDPLTQIYNRRLMEEAEQELRRAKRYGRPTSVLMIDIDYF